MIINTDLYRNEDNERLEHALLMAFDPFTNEEVKSVIVNQTTMNLTDMVQLHDYYMEPVRCILRIKDLADTWIKKNGSDGYFCFIEQFMGNEIHGEEMKFYISL